MAALQLEPMRGGGGGGPLLVVGVVALVAALGGGVVGAGLGGPSRLVVEGTGTAAADHVLTVTGTGTVTVVPDLATVRLGVAVERPSAVEARDAAAAAMTRVVAAIRAGGVAERDIATAHVALVPVWWYPADRKPELTGYQVTNVVTVKVRDLDRTGELVDAAVAAGATTVEGIAFSVEDRTAAERTARERAIADARAKATTLAGGAGVDITGIVSIAESVTTPPWYGREYGAAGGKDATPVLAGTTDVVITVTVGFLLE